MNLTFLHCSDFLFEKSCFHLTMSKCLFTCFEGLLIVICRTNVTIMIVYSIIWRTSQFLCGLWIWIFNCKLLNFIYQAEIGSISSDIKILQEKSMDMGLRLKNRKVLQVYINKPRFWLWRFSYIATPFCLCLLDKQWLVLCNCNFYLESKLHQKAVYILTIMLIHLWLEFLKFMGFF